MSQSSTGLSDHERRTGIHNARSVRGPLTDGDFPLDHVHRWKKWCAMVGISTTTGWRLRKAGKVIVTELSPKLIGVRHRHHLEYLAAGEQRNDEAA